MFTTFVMMLRSEDLHGPYEEKELIHTHGVELDREPNQGGLTQTEAGEWYITSLKMPLKVVDTTAFFYRNMFLSPTEDKNHIRLYKSVCAIDGIQVIRNHSGFINGGSQCNVTVGTNQYEFFTCYIVNSIGIPCCVYYAFRPICV